MISITGKNLEGSLMVWKIDPAQIMATTIPTVIPQNTNEKILCPWGGNVKS